MVADKLLERKNLTVMALGVYLSVFGGKSPHFLCTLAPDYHSTIGNFYPDTNDSATMRPDLIG